MSRRAWWVVVFLGVGCVPLSEPDGGTTPDASVRVDPDAGSTDGGAIDAGPIDAGDIDAGTVDAGEADAGTPDAITLSLSADDRRIHLVWDAGRGSTAGWIVLRAGLPIAQLSGSVREYEDFTAPAGSLDGFDASATRGLPDGIELEWTIPSATPGVPVTYRVRTLGDASVESNEVEGQRAAPTLLGFDVHRGDGGWSFAPVETLWLDTSAPSPSVAVTSLQAVVTPNDWTSSVVVRATGDFARDASTQDYTIRARTSVGADLEAFVSGDRGGNRIAFQWQRSTDDSPDAFVDLPFVHGRLWLDPEAVLGEGRYYRVIAQAGAKEWISAPARAELRRPLFVVGDEFSSYLLRDDGLCLPLISSSVPPTQFPPVTDFVTRTGRPCGLLLDGGVECALPSGAHVQLALPPASSIVGGTTVCVTTADGGIACAPDVPYDVTGMVKVYEIGRGRLCGRYTDGGVSCVASSTSTIPPIIVDPDPVSVWVGSANAFITASYSDGSTRGYGYPTVMPPANDAGYVAGFHDQYANCGVRSDGWVRCTGDYLGRWSEQPPLSPVTWKTVFLHRKGLCGLTTEGRVRCRGTGLVPVRPPVRALSLDQGDVMALTNEGLLDARGGALPARFMPSVEDRYSSIAGGFGYQEQCVLRDDGGASCNGVNATEPLTRIASGFGLKPDGGLFSWGRPWPVEGPFVDLVDLRDTICARRTDGGWTCEDPSKNPPEGLFTQIAIGSSACGLSPSGRLSCWRNPPPEIFAQHRFRHVSSLNVSCATTVEGEAMCWGNGAATALPWDDFTEFHQDIVGCGIRQDGTMAFRPGTNLIEFPSFAP